MAVRLFDINGANIGGDGTFWYYPGGGDAPTTAWATRSGLFGPGQVKDFPANAYSMTVGVLMNNTATAGVYHDVEQLKIEDYSANAAVVVEQQARLDGDGALALQITGLTTTVDDNTAAIAQEVSTRSSETGALTTATNTLTSRLNNAGGSGVTMEQRFVTDASSITGLQAQYTIRINNNGRVSGFGLASGAGGTSEFAILADRFVVIDPANNATAAYPFQVVGGNVYIRKAFIQTITADQISVANLQALSANMGTLTAGQIQLGSLGGGNYKFLVDTNGNLTLQSAVSGARLKLTNSGTTVGVELYDAANVRRGFFGIE